MNYNLESLWDNLKEQKISQIENTNLATKTQQLDMCTNCNSNNIVIYNGEVVCRDCGDINYGIIDTNAEWRFYGHEDSKYSDPTRCGLPTNELLPQSSLGSTIGYKSGESYQMRKIRNYHLWNAMPYKERALYNVFESIQIRAINSGIPVCIIEEAKNLYKKISEIKINRGSNRHGIIASCIYKACVLQDCPRSAKEIAEIFKLNITHMTKGCKRFDEIMHSSNNNTIIRKKCTTSIDFIKRFCSNLNLGSNILDICTHVCKKAEEYNLVSKSIPPSIAAGSIYLVCNLLNINITKKDISKTCNISEVTINKCFKNLLEYHIHLFPKYILDKLYI